MTDGTDPGKPDLEVLALWLAGDLSAEAARVVDDRVASDDRLQADVRWLAEVLESARALPLARPPRPLSDALRRLFRERNGVPAPVRRFHATVVMDSRRTGSAVGTRGMSDAGGWSLLLATPVAEVVLDVNAADEDRIRVGGRLFPIEVPSVELTTVSLTTTDGHHTGATVDGDRFRFEPLLPSSAMVTVATAEWELTGVVDLKGS